jgi:hypothetical protein
MSSYAYESDDDDDKPLPPLKNRKQQGEFDDDDVPIRLKKFSKQPDDARIRSETDTYLNQDMNNTKKRLEDIKQNFFDVCLENFEQNEAGAIGFFVNCMKQGMEANREIASITHKIASLAEAAENSQTSVRYPTRGVRQTLARSLILRRLAEVNEKHGYFKSGQP